MLYWAHDISFHSNFDCYCIGAYLFVFLLMQSVDVVKYTDEEYEKYLTDPVGTNIPFDICGLSVLFVRTVLERVEVE